MHLFHCMYHGDSGELLATSEQMLLHVDTQAARTSEMQADVRAALDHIMEAHGKLPRPASAGRPMGLD